MGQPIVTGFLSNFIDVGDENLNSLNWYNVVSVTGPRELVFKVIREVYELMDLKNVCSKHRNFLCHL